MNDIIENFTEGKDSFVTYNYFINVLNARGISLTREQMLQVRKYNNRIPISFLKNFENIGLLTSNVPQIDQRFIMLGRKDALEHRIPLGTPQLPFQYTKLRTNNTLQAVYVPSSMTAPQAYADENNARLRIAEITYEQKPVYNQTSRGLITTGAAYKYIPEPRIAANTKSGVFKNLSKNYTIDSDRNDLSGNSVRLTPRITTNIKGITISDINDKDQTITVDMRDGSRRVTRVNDPEISKGLDNSGTMYKSTIPTYQPPLDRVPDINNSILRRIYSSADPRKMSIRDRKDVIKSMVHGERLTKPDLNTSGRFDYSKMKNTSINLNNAASFRAREINRYSNDLNGSLIDRASKDRNIEDALKMINMSESIGDFKTSQMLRSQLTQGFNQPNIGQTISQILPVNNNNNNMYMSSVINRSRAGG